jgi:membrane-associated phospholipid phosphatase
MIERRPPWPPRLARLISIAAHPLVLSPLTVALASRNWRWTLIIAASTTIPIAAVLLWNVRRGVWSDFDVSRRDQRSGLYWIAIPIFAVTAFLVPAFTRSMLALVCILLIALALSRFQKTSLHLLFGAFCAVILWRAYPWSAFVMAGVLVALAWARWYLKHHTPVEIATGTLLGLVVGIYTISS